MSLALIEYKSYTAGGKLLVLRMKVRNLSGLHHLSFWVDDIEGAQEALEENGSKYMMGEVSDNTYDAFTYYELKYRVPNNVNVVVDSTHSNRTGAIK